MIVGVGVDETVIVTLRLGVGVIVGDIVFVGVDV